MELEDLISKLQTELDLADLAADSGNEDYAKEHLRKAKELLDVVFLNDQ